VAGPTARLGFIIPPLERVDPMFVIRAILLLMGAVLVSSPAAAQNRIDLPAGGGMTGTALSDRIRAEIYRTEGATGENVRLIVLWRGQPRWEQGAPPTPGTPAVARRSSTSRGQSVLGGPVMINSSTTGGITRELRFDSRSGKVWVNGQEAGTAFPDSTMIVMVDRVDSVGGPPTTRVVQVAGLRGDAIPSGEDRRDPVSGAVILVSARTGLMEVLSRIPELAEFIR
jgi:hypothetical protein